MKMSNRINLANVSNLIDAGFTEDEARFITENREVCPQCPHLMILHEEATERSNDTEDCKVCPCRLEPTWRR